MTGRLNVLIVEDSRDDAELLVERLREAGFEPQARIVDTEADYQAALDPGLDVVLCDYHLPQFDAPQALRLLKARTDLDVPFIIVSGAIGEERAVEMMRAGADDYLLKDRLTRLGVAVEHALQEKRERDERRRARAEIERLAAIVESSNDAIVGCDLEGTITSWNAGAARMFGYSADEAVGKPIALLLLPGAASPVAEIHSALAGSESVVPFETQRITKDGRILDVFVSVSPIVGGEGRITGASAIFHDISERKRLERALRQEARLMELLGTLARTANEAGTPRDALRRCVEHICAYGQWTLGCAAVFAPDHAGGPPDWVYWHPANLARYEALVRRSATTDHHATCGYFIGRVLRERRPVWISDLAALHAPGRMGLAASLGLRAAFAFPVHLGTQIVGFLEFFSEAAREPDAAFMEAIPTVGAQLARLVERERSEAEVRAARDRLEGILSSLREVVYSCDYETYAPTYVSAAVTEISGRDPAAYHDDPLLWFNIIHPDDQAAVSAALAVLKREGRNCAEYRILRPDGGIRYVQNWAQVVRDDSGRPARIDGVVIDVSERKLAEARAERLVHHDGLTDLPNRLLFQDRLEIALAHARRRGEMLAVMLINLDRFKKINEDLGFDAGDVLIREVARRLQRSLRDVDTLARVGGDEFAVLVEGITSRADVAAVAEKLEQALGAPFEVGGQEVYISASIGIAEYPGCSGDAAALVQNAEIAMRRAKQDDGGHRFYDESSMPRARMRLEMESRLRHALERGELTLHYQPKIEIATGKIRGVEALLRWNSPVLGEVSPATFIPVAEETGLIVPIGAWVMEAACAQAAQWRRLGWPLRVAVNLSPRQFRDRDLVATVAAALRASGLDAAALELEITEGAAMSRPEQTIVILNQLRELGVTLAVDDFGTGYSSLSYLKRFPLNSLKIDRAFVRDLDTDRNSVTIVGATIALARSLNLSTVAEGVENDRQHAELRRLGCDLGQGFLYSKPLPAEQLTGLRDQVLLPDSGKRT